MSPKSLMNKFAKSKTDFWKNEELQRVIGTGTLKVSVQSILNLLFPGQIHCSACVLSSATLQAVGTELVALCQPMPAPAAGRGVCAAVAGRTLTARGQDTTAPATRRESWSLLVHCLLCFSAVAGRRPWLFPPALAGPFGYSAHLSVASMATPWLCSCFPTGMLSPQTVSRLAPVPSPMTITLAGSAVRGRAATAHHPLLFSLDNQFPGCWLQAVFAFLQHPAPQGLATWA